MKLGQLTMDDYAIKFLELLRYVSYIKDEKVNIQRFLSGLMSKARTKHNSTRCRRKRKI
jgi:hypothetical protein